VLDFATAMEVKVFSSVMVVGLFLLKMSDTSVVSVKITIFAKIVKIKTNIPNTRKSSSKFMLVLRLANIVQLD
jgi:hypothetical protein